MVSFNMFYYNTDIVKFTIYEYSIDIKILTVSI